MRCSATSPEKNVQCGLPAGHDGNHANGTMVKPWASAIVAGAVAGFKAGMEATPTLTPVGVCSDHYDCHDCSAHETYLLAAERERCAQIVESYDGHYFGSEDGKNWNCLEVIAAKIREGK